MLDRKAAAANRPSSSSSNTIQGKEGEAPIALVGKGLTPDAGGISIKPAANMDEMKYDMCGGAVVLGTLLAVAELKLPLNVIGPPSRASENLPAGDANKPGDIVKSMSGQTIEVLNTDAEGPADSVRRAHLCRALQAGGGDRHRQRLPAPASCALGHHASGLMSNNDQLARELCWPPAGTPMIAPGNSPLWDEYQKQLRQQLRRHMAKRRRARGRRHHRRQFPARYTKTSSGRISTSPARRGRPARKKAPPGDWCHCSRSTSLNQPTIWRPRPAPRPRSFPTWSTNYSAGGHETAAPRDMAACRLTNKAFLLRTPYLYSHRRRCRSATTRQPALDFSAGSFVPHAIAYDANENMPVIIGRTHRRRPSTTC